MIPTAPTSDPLPDYLEKAVKALRDIGFDASAYFHDAHTREGQNFPPHGSISVGVPKQDPRIEWEKLNLEKAVFVPGAHPGMADVFIPRGFDYHQGRGGVGGGDDVRLTTLANSESQAFDFVECFTHPNGADNKVSGPLAQPTKPAASHAMRP